MTTILELLTFEYNYGILSKDDLAYYIGINIITQDQFNNVVNKS